MALRFPDSIPASDASALWDALAAIVDRFIAAWEEGEASLAKFLPDGPAPLRRLALVELIKIDLDYRWQRKQPRTIEEYVAKFPELAQPRLPCDLLYEEHHVRKRAGDGRPPEELLRRFPEHAEELARLLGLPAHSTVLVGRHAVPKLSVGDRIDDFDVLTLLGEGTFAKVYLAWQRSMQRQVALKVSPPRGVEAETLAQLDHRHIVRVYDQRVLQDQGIQLLYMQPIAGGTLQHVIAHLRSVLPATPTGSTLLEAIDLHVSTSGGKPFGGSSAVGGSMTDPVRRRRYAALSWPEVVCRIGIRLANALDYAARKGVLHRDLKPANVLMTPDGEPLLTDFNISFGSKLEGANPANFFGGSLAYMSPEQLDACNPSNAAGPETLDARSDLYSLGVLLWELLAGRRPFPEECLGPNGTADLNKLAEERRAGIPANARPAACPDALLEVLTTTLAAEPGDRYSAGNELARQLALCLNPQAYNLLAEPRDWRRWVRRFPTVAVLMVALVPNLGAALFNVAYNYEEIIGRLPNLESAFWIVQSIVNGLAFPAGMLVFAWAVRPVAKELKGLQGLRHSEAREKHASTSTSADHAIWSAAEHASLVASNDVSRRCLALGHAAAIVSVSAWLVAGIAYPAGLALAGPLPLSAMFHFLASLALCGFIAAVYPFFAVTLIAVRALYPPLFSPRTADDDSFAELRRRLNVYLVLAATVPTFGMMVLVLTGSTSRFALAALSVVGFVGFGLAFLCHRAVNADLDALDEARRPVRDLINADVRSRFATRR